jgi:hypothetical protein
VVVITENNYYLLRRIPSYLVYTVKVHDIRAVHAEKMAVNGEPLPQLSDGKAGQETLPAGVDIAVVSRCLYKINLPGGNKEDLVPTGMSRKNPGLQSAAHLLPMR